MREEPFFPLTGQIMRRAICLFCWVAALALTGTTAVRADMLPEPDVDRMCIEVDLIIEGEHLGNNRVKILRVYKPSGLIHKKATHIDVADLQKHVRVPGQLRQFQWLDATEIRTNKLVLFLTFRSKTKTWHSHYATDQEGQWGSAGLYWYDQQTCYGYQQIMNPGPYVLMPGSQTPRRSRVPESIQAMRAEIGSGLANLRRWQAVLAVKDPAEKARQMARFLLPHTAPPGYRGALRNELREELAKLGGHAVAALIEVINRARPDESLNDTVLILFDIERPARPAVPALCKLLQSPGETSRYYVLSAVRTAGDPAAIPHVRPLLKVKDDQVAVAAAKALGALGDRESFDAIAALLPEKYTSNQLARTRDLLHALHSLHPGRAKPFIQRAVDDPAFEGMRSLLTPE